MTINVKNQVGQPIRLGSDDPPLTIPNGEEGVLQGPVPYVVMPESSNTYLPFIGKLVDNETYTATLGIGDNPNILTFTATGQPVQYRMKSPEVIGG